MLLQELAIEKDKQRLQYKAEQNVIRNLRFRDARWRTIGIDEQALREQMEDNRRRRDAEKDDERIDRESLIVDAVRLILTYECLVLFYSRPAQ